MPDFPKNHFIRDAMGESMAELGRRDPRVVVINADLAGTCRNRSFGEMFPDRFFNVGIAEQFMVSFAAGLAHEGYIPYVFTMVPFVSMRACEQCRTDVAYANANVRFIAPYSGCSGGISGATHWGMEDCAIMCSIPNMAVLEPCDTNEARKMMEYSLFHQGPVYIRSSVEPVPDIFDAGYEFEIGKAVTVKEGDDGAFICSGITVKYALEAASAIEEKHQKHIRVVNMHTLKPVDAKAVMDAVKTGRIVVAQDHNIIGGLGQLVAGMIAGNGVAVKLRILGIPDRFAAMAHAPYLYRQFGYDAQGLEQAMMDLLDGSRAQEAGSQSGKVMTCG